jgi:hypothetical protein
MSVRNTLLVLVAAAMLVSLQACDRTIEQVVSTDQKPLSCADCHDGSNLITGKVTQWEESGHGVGEAYARGTSASCAGCHSGNAFREMIEAGGNPGSVAMGDPDPTRQDCRACHMIHDTYTMGDFALRSEEPVEFYATEGVTFDGGEGNLCVNCHQPRRFIPEPVDGVISGISSHWGPHHGPQSAMLLGVGGAGVDDMVGPHYGAVTNTCVDCHMGEGRNHTFEPDDANCQSCHPDIDGFDYKGVQTEIQALTDELGALLLAAGLINENGADGHPTVSSAPTDEAMALWNWLYVAHEDKSIGVHNPDYAKALLEEGIARMSASAPRADLNR